MVSLAWMFMVASLVCVCNRVPAALAATPAAPHARPAEHACCHPDAADHVPPHHAPSCPHCDHAQLSTVDVVKLAPLASRAPLCAVSAVPLAAGGCCPLDARVVRLDAHAPPRAPAVAHVVLRL